MLSLDIIRDHRGRPIFYRTPLEQEWDRNRASLSYQSWKEDVRGLACVYLMLWKCDRCHKRGWEIYDDRSYPGHYIGSRAFEEWSEDSGENNCACGGSFKVFHVVEMPGKKIVLPGK